MQQQYRLTVNGYYDANGDEPIAVSATTPLPVLVQSPLPVSASSPLPVTVSSGSIQTSFPSGMVDAFGRLRTSQVDTLFDSKLLYDAMPLTWDDQQISGTAASAYNANQSSVTLSTTAAVGVRQRQTKRRFPYFPGKSSLVLLTGILGAPAATSKARCGLYDDKNGLFFESGATSFSVNRRTYTSGAAVDTQVLQANFNIDTLDGHGPSKVNLDLTKTQIFGMDFEWLGVGCVRFFVVVDGAYIFCHQMNHANNLTTVYMTTPNLPVRWELITTGAVSRSLTAICASVMSGGGQADQGKVFTVDTGITGLTTGNNTSLYPLLAIRLNKLDGSFAIPDFSVFCTGATVNFRYCLLLNPTITGTALSFAALTNSIIDWQAPTNATTVSGGTQIYSDYGVSRANGSVPDLHALNIIGSTIAGVADVLVLAVQNLTGATNSYFAALSIQEV